MSSYDPQDPNTSNQSGGQQPPPYSNQPPAYPGGPEPSYDRPAATKTWHVTTAGVLTLVFASLGGLIAGFITLGVLSDPDAFEREWADATGQSAEGIGEIYLILGIAMLVVAVLGIVGGILFLRRSGVGRVLIYIAAGVSMPLSFLLISLFGLVSIGIAIWVIVLISLRPVREWLKAG